MPMNDEAKEVSSNFKSLMQFLGHVVHVCPELTEVAEEKKAWVRTMARSRAFEKR